MKNKAIEILKSKQTPQQEFNELLGVFTSSGGNANLVRNYNVRGYYAEGLQSLRYDVRQHLNISDADIRNYTPQLAVAKAEPTKTITLESVVQDMSIPEKEGFKLSVKYPFLRSKDCPDEFKILINDAISAFHRVKEQHEELFQMAYAEDGTATDEETFYAKASELLADFELNRDIYEELDHYEQTGEVLGNHPVFGDLKLEREVAAMSLEELAKAKNNVKSNISKRKKEMEKLNANPEENAEALKKVKEKLSYFETKQKLIDARLKGE